MRPLHRKQSMLSLSEDTMKSLFEKADLNHDGSLTKKELRKVMHSLNMSVSDKGIDQVHLLFVFFVFIQSSISVVQHFGQER